MLFKFPIFVLHLLFSFNGDVIKISAKRNDISVYRLGEQTTNPGQQIRLFLSSDLVCIAQEAAWSEKDFLGTDHVRET